MSSDYDKNDPLAVFRYMERSYDELRDRMATLDSFPCGDSIQVEFEAKLVEKHNINPFGRMTIQRGVPYYHAGPSKIDTSLRYDMPIVGHFNEFEKWSMNEACSFEFPDVYPFPKPIVEREHNATHRIEKLCLGVMGELYGTFHLEHPADGTIWRTEKMSVSINVLPERFAKVREILRCQKKINMPMDEIVSNRIVHYLGSNGVPKGNLPEKWVALVPNPFQEYFPFKPYVVEYVEGGVAMSYVRHEIEHEIYFDSCPNYYLIPPQTLDRLSNMNGMSYFLATNLETVADRLRGEDVRTKGPVFGYLGEMPPYVGGVSEDDKYVYDKQGLGTYLSRRSLIKDYALQRGKLAAPIFVSYSKNAITYYDYVPRNILPIVADKGIVSHIGPFVVEVSPPMTTALVYGQFLEEGNPCDNMIGKYIFVNKYVDKGGISHLDIPPSWKRPLYVFDNRLHFRSNQMVLIEKLRDEGFIQDSTTMIRSYQTREMPRSSYIEAAVSILEECPLRNFAGKYPLEGEEAQVGISDMELGRRLGISIGQVNSLLTNNVAAYYMGQTRYIRTSLNWWISRKRIPNDGVDYQELHRKWKSTGEVLVKVNHLKQVMTFLFNQGEPVSTVVDKGGGRLLSRGY